MVSIYRKPRLRVRYGIWECCTPLSRFIGYGYTPDQAWKEWKAIQGFQ